MRYVWVMGVFICCAFVQTAQANTLHCAQEIEHGRASWYGPRFEGKPTASGELFYPTKFSAAHPTLPFGTVLKVVNLSNNRDVVVEVNDRGNFASMNRVIDLSEAAAIELGMKRKGIAKVAVFSCN